MKKKLIMMNPPLRLGPVYIDYPQYLTLGAVSNAAVLREAGMDVSVADAFCEKSSAAVKGKDFASLGAPMEDLTERFGEFAAEAVVVAVSPFLSPHVANAHCAYVFEAARAAWPDACLIAADCYFSGMHYIEYDGKELMRSYPEIDSVVKYETEAMIAGVAAGCRRDSGAALECDATDVVPDNLPVPAWDLVSLEDYYLFQERYEKVFSSGGGVPYLRSLPVATTRGCPFGCVFCASNPGQKKHVLRAASPENVQRTLKAYADSFGAQKIVFLESAPNLNKDRFQKVLEIVESLNLKCDFPNGLRADCVTREHLKILKKIAGRVKISEESGCEKTLEKIGKRLSLRDSEKTLEMMSEEGVASEVHYVIGFPFETPQEANLTLERAVAMKERHGAAPLVQYATPVPGSEMHARAQELGLLSDFNPGLLYSHFTGEPSFDRPEFHAERLKEMMFCFRKRLADSQLDKLIVNLTYECSNDCVFCAVGDRKRAHGDTARIVEYLKEYRRRGARSVDFDGGEPTAHPAFMALVAAASELGYENINVTTNARKLADRGAASRFLLSGLTSVLVSIHGHTAELHEIHTRRTGSFDETVAGIKHIVELKPKRVEFSINATITEWNAPFFDEMLAFFESLGAGAVNAQFITPHGNAMGFDGYDARKLAEVVAAPIIARKGRFTVRVINLAHCIARDILGETEPETGKFSRDMVFADSPPMNLGKYLDQRRKKKAECESCPAAVACAGFYVFGKEKTTDKYYARELPETEKATCARDSRKKGIPA
ncbi:MAG TPA: radical SAM protein [bacterium]|mgnify:CR=1 FL=1|nr:radical SAM protein [bacterium]